MAPDDVAPCCSTLALDAADEGVPLRPQVAGRPIGLLLGLQTSHPLLHRPTYAAIASLPLDERVARMRDPDVRDADPGESADGVRRPLAYIGMGLDRIFPLGDPPDYEPAPEVSVARSRRARGRRPRGASLRPAARRTKGTELLLRPLLGYSDFNHDALREMLLHPSSVLGLGDGGAHVRVICDASIATSC